MASLSELVSAADYTQRGKLAADPVYSGVSSFASGLSSGADFSGSKQTKRLEIGAKLLEIQTRIKQMQQQAEGQKIAKAALQAAGFLPLDPEDADVARTVANGAIGTADVDPAIGTKTDAGKLNVLVNKANKTGGVEFDPARTANSLYGKNPGIRLKNKKKEPGVTAADKMRVRSLASQMAKSAYAAQIQREGAGQDAMGFDQDPNRLISQYVPTPEDIAKFEPEAHKYLYGKTPDAPAPANKKAGVVTDPLDKVGDLEDVSSLWDLLKKK